MTSVEKSCMFACECIPVPQTQTFRADSCQVSGGLSPVFRGRLPRVDTQETPVGGLGQQLYLQEDLRGNSQREFPKGRSLHKGKAISTAHLSAEVGMWGPHHTVICRLRSPRARDPRPPVGQASSFAKAAHRRCRVDQACTQPLKGK